MARNHESARESGEVWSKPEEERMEEREEERRGEGKTVWRKEGEQTEESRQLFR